MDSVVAPGRVLVISPHLDDAVLGCGDLLACCPGSQVLTVLAGMPPADSTSADWDRQCGFTQACDAMQARWAEDDAAMAILAAKALRLAFLDSQYDSQSAIDSIAAAVASHIVREMPDTLLVPMGLFHCDHEHVSDALLHLFCDADPSMPPLRWLAYEDVLYRRRRGVLQRRLSALSLRGICATPVSLEGVRPSPLKARAVAAYASQLRKLNLTHASGDAATPERYWLLDLCNLAYS